MRRSSSRRLLTALLATAGIGFVWPQPVLATSIVFNLKEYVRSTGSPNVTTDTFAACRPDRPFRLRVENGPHGSEQVSSASIVLNGLEVVAESQFDARPGRIESAVRLGGLNTLTVRLAGKPGGTLGVSILSDVGCEVTLAEPEAGAVVPEGVVVVRGTVVFGPDAGVTVNGVPAAIHGDRFVALVPVNPAISEIVAIATRNGGMSAEARQAIVVTAQPPRALALRASPPGGVPPLQVGFSLFGSAPTAEIRLDLEGRGLTAFQGPTLEGRSFTYEAPGLYTPTVTVTDPGGVPHTVTALVHVLDPAALDGRLQAQWTAMKDALRQGDVEAALSYVAGQARDGYRLLLNALTIPLDQVDSVLTDITPVSLEEDRAEYEMVRVDNEERLSYFVLFVRDADGVWRVKFF